MWRLLHNVGFSRGGLLRFARNDGVELHQERDSPSVQPLQPAAYRNRNIRPLAYPLLLVGAATREPIMHRRTMLKGAAALLALPSIVRAESVSTLKFVPYADLALLDPMVAAFVTRNHVMMVFDTLYALDEAGVAQPQMLAGHTVSDDGKTWKLTLREGLLFHDGTKVLGRDVVASLQRWWTNDAYGQALAAATDELSAPSDSTVQFRLKHPFALLPQALAHPTNLVAAIMPERLARTPSDKRLTEMVGSGPYRYVASERVAGARNVYAKFADYKPRPNGTPSFCAGPRLAHFDRIEWLTTPIRQLRSRRCNPARSIGSSNH